MSRIDPVHLGDEWVRVLRDLDKPAGTGLRSRVRDRLATSLGVAAAGAASGVALGTSQTAAAGTAAQVATTGAVATGAEQAMTGAVAGAPTMTGVVAAGQGVGLAQASSALGILWKSLLLIHPAGIVSGALLLAGGAGVVSYQALTKPPIAASVAPTPSALQTRAGVAAAPVTEQGVATREGMQEPPSRESEAVVKATHDPGSGVAAPRGASKAQPAARSASNARAKVVGRAGNGLNALPGAAERTIVEPVITVEARASANLPPSTALVDFPPPPTAPRESSLGEQQALLDAARKALHDGEPNVSLRLLAEHEAHFPRTLLEEEREMLHIKALVAVGNRTGAFARSARFRARFPNSLLLPSLDRTMSEIP